MSEKHIPGILSTDTALKEQFRRVLDGSNYCCLSPKKVEIRDLEYDKFYRCVIQHRISDYFIRKIVYCSGKYLLMNVLFIKDNYLISLEQFDDYEFIAKHIKEEYHFSLEPITIYDIPYKKIS